MCLSSSWPSAVSAACVIPITVTGENNRIENLEKHRIYIENETMASKSSKRSIVSSEDNSLSESETGPDDEKTIPFLR